MESICSRRSGNEIEILTQAQIIPDNDNEYDKAAVRIEIAGKLVGYLSRPNARKWISKMISEGIYEETTCNAKIKWDRNIDEEGSYGVWLDIDLTLPNSKPEDTAYVDTMVSDEHSNHLEFLVNELNEYELLFCNVGDSVNLWVSNEIGKVFIYKRGTTSGDGKIGVCPDVYYQAISEASRREAKIANINEGSCKISCRLISREMEIQDGRQKLFEELSKKYSPKSSIKTVVHTIKNKKLMKGDKLFLDIKDKEHYLLNPLKLTIAVLNQNKAKIGDITIANIVIRILKAHYNGYRFDVNVISFDNQYYPRAEIEIIPEK